LKLLHLEIAAHPPQSAVLNFELTAEAAPSSLVQLGLFAPQTPEPSRLDVTLARLKAIVGEDRVGSPVLVDGHRPGAFEMTEFRADLRDERDAMEVPQPRMGLRRMRPRLAVRMNFRDSEFVDFQTREHRFRVAAAYGPWRSSGYWWAIEPWAVDEWDVLAERDDGSPVACLLVRDQLTNTWWLEALYD
jgi:protein ImuB